MTTTALAPVTITARYPSFRTGQLQIWGAVTTDGVWAIERVEDTGTPWTVEHIPTGAPAGLYGTLRAARIAIANGWAINKVAQHFAERGRLF